MKLPYIHLTGDSLNTPKGTYSTTS